MNVELFIYKIVALTLVVFFIISVYNLVQLKVENNPETYLRLSLDIAIECMVIFIGFFVAIIFFNKKVNKNQIWFCKHVFLFLIFTGITALIATSKKIESINQQKI